jgi:hypothetical protein
MNNGRPDMYENYYKNKFNFVLNEIYTEHSNDDHILNEVSTIVDSYNNNDDDSNNNINNIEKVNNRYVAINELSYIACELFKEKWLKLICDYLNNNDIYLEEKGDIIPDIERIYYYRNHYSSNIIVDIILEIYYFNEHIRNNIYYYHNYKKTLQSLVLYDNMTMEELITHNSLYFYDYNYIHRIASVTNILPYRNL